MYMGLMSGTSCDGVDCVLAHVEADRFQELHHSFIAFPERLQTTLIALGSGTLENEIDVMLETLPTLTRFYYDAVQTTLDKAGLNASHIRALGLHGQTIRHRPQWGETLQISQPAHLAYQTGIDVIADFRHADLAAGGEGAPLVPRFHEAIFQREQTVAILNLGGIANLSVIRGRHTPDTTWGSDIGPANMLLDAWVAHHGRGAYDKDGAWSRTGRINTTLLHQLLAHPFFDLPFPKSTGRECFNLSMLPPLVHSLTPEDVARTLTRFTAQCVALTLMKAAPSVTHLFVAGGGALNPLIMEDLQALLTIPVDTTESLGMHPMHVEAAAFAWLAWAHDARVTGNLPSATGAHKAVILGARYPHTPY